MSKFIAGPLFVSVDAKWPFTIFTKNADGEVTHRRDMPCQSTSHRSASEALAGKDMKPEWNAAEHNASALADETLRASAPEMLSALKLARECIDRCRQCLADCGTNPATQQIDTYSKAGLAEYDAVLAEIDAAIRKAEAA